MNELIRDYLTDIKETTYQEVYDLYNNYEMKDIEHYRNAFDSIYLLKHDDLINLVADWADGKLVPTFKFMAIYDNKYIAADNEDNEFFMEEYKNIDKAILYLNSSIEVEILNNNDLETCIKILEQEDELTL